MRQGLPSVLDNLCLQVLAKCDVFDSVEQVKSLFTVTGLSGFEDDLPDSASGRTARATEIKYFLLTTKGQNNECLMLLFVEQLQAYYPEEDEKQLGLKRLHNGLRAEALFSQVVLCLVDISVDKLREIFRYLAPELSTRNQKIDNARIAELLWDQQDRNPFFQFMQSALSLLDTDEKRNSLKADLGILAKVVDIDLHCLPTVPLNSVSDHVLRPVLLIAIEPQPITSHEQFSVKAWLYRAKQPEPVQTKLGETYSREALQSNLPNLLADVRKMLSPEQQSDLLIELMLPVCLWDWDLENIKLSVGPIKRPIQERYALVLRSWERSFVADYSETHRDWHDKWEQGQALVRESLHLESCCQIDLEQWYERLQGQELYGLMAIFPIGNIAESSDLQNFLGTIVALGFPVVWWPLGCKMTADQLHQVEQVFIAGDLPNLPYSWLEQLKQDKTLRGWHLLWDNPERLPPEHILHSPE